MAVGAAGRKQAFLRFATNPKSCRDAHGTIGWGGWTRTNTVLINSEVSYQLDHAPTGSPHSTRTTSGTETVSHQLPTDFCASSSCARIRSFHDVGFECDRPICVSLT